MNPRWFRRIALRSSSIRSNALNLSPSNNKHIQTLLLKQFTLASAVQQSWISNHSVIRHCCLDVSSVKIPAPKIPHDTSGKPGLTLLQRTKLINNNNNQDDIYGAVIMAKPLREFTRFIWWMQTQRRGGRQPSDQANRLGPPERNRRYRPHPPSPFYYYSAREVILILPSHGGWKAEST